MNWRILHVETDGAAVAALLDRGALADAGAGETAEKVREIIRRVRAEGDAALSAYTRELDGVAVPPAGLRLTPAEIGAGAASASAELRQAVERAAGNIRRFHEMQRRRDLELPNADGLLGLRFVPLARVGAYVPGGAGGTTPLISSLLMNVIPAQVAGVPSIAVCSPPRADGTLAPGLLYALQLLGVDEIYRIGGAQAVAAMAYGTPTMPPVDKIVGPGNRFVTEAKRQVYGRVGLDMLAGPSEVAIIADGSADPRHVAADLLAQAEHDPEAGAILMTPERELAIAVGRAIEEFLPGLPRAAVIAASLAAHGGAIVTRDLDEALVLADKMAPEHLELLVADPSALAGRVRRAGAVFLGPYSPEALGDYAAGSNHVLPTNGTARFSSGLGVDDFLRRMAVIQAGKDAFAADAPAALALARAEGLAAHALSLEIRMAPNARRAVAARPAMDRDLEEGR